MNPHGTAAFDLTRHFFREFFYLRFLTDTGADAIKRVIIWVIAGLLALSILFPQFVVGRYVKMRTVVEYRHALLSDQLFTITVSMLIVGFVAALVCQSLFPDETDYRVLLALPVTRRLVFGTKMLALILFATIFIVSTNLIFGLAFAAAAGGRWAEHGIVQRMLAHAPAAGLASVFAGAVVMSVQGVGAVLSPRAWLRQVSVVTQTAMICALILSIPAIGRPSSGAGLLSAHAPVSFALPPVWFLALEQVLLGHRDPFVVRLGGLALIGLVLSVLLIAVCYLTIYRRFDQMVVRSGQPPRRGRFAAMRVGPSRVRQPVRLAIASFTGATLRRSSLHQVVFCSISAIGIAVSVNSVIGFPTATGPRQAAAMMFWFVEAVIEMPLVFLFFGVAAARTALLLPLDLRANWLFRLTENPAAKRDAVSAVERSLVWLGVAPYVAVTFVVQVVILGAGQATLAVLPSTLLGLGLVEWVLRRWHRLPFTCSYIPGKRPLVHSILLTFAAFVVFVNLGGLLIHFSLNQPALYVVLCAVLATTVSAMRRSRLASSAHIPLEFEDTLPDDVTIIPWS